MSKRLLFLPLVLAGATATVAVPSRSEACSCIARGEFFLAPANGQAGVPTNTRIWSGELFGRPIEVTDGNGNPIAGTETAIQGVDGTIKVFTPSAAIPLGTRVFVRAGGGLMSEFEITVDADAEKPPIPAELGREEHSEGGGIDLFGGSSSCGDESHSVTITLNNVNTLTVVDTENAAELDALVPSGRVTTFGFDQQLTLGSGACLYNWPGAAEGNDTQVRFGSYDLAGNFSGWSEAAPLESPKGCACVSNADSAPKSAWLLVLTFGALALFRSKKARLR